MLSVDIAIDHLEQPLYDWLVILRHAVYIPHWQRRLLSMLTAVHEHTTRHLMPDLSDIISEESTAQEEAPASDRAPTSHLHLSWWQRLARLGGCKSPLRWLAHAVSLDKILLRVGLQRYEELAIFYLKCFIHAHRHTQDSFREHDRETGAAAPGAASSAEPRLSGHMHGEEGHTRRIEGSR